MKRHKPTPRTKFRTHSKRILYFLDAEGLYREVETISHLAAKDRSFCAFWQKRNAIKNFMISQKRTIKDSNSFMDPNKDLVTQFASNNTAN